MSMTTDDRATTSHSWRRKLATTSLALIADQALLAGSGFIFWQLATHSASTRAVGVANATLGVLSLLGLLATMGLTSVLQRFLSAVRDQTSVVRAACVFAGGAGTLLGLIAVTVARMMGLSGAAQSWWVVLAVASVAMGSVAQSALVAQHRAPQTLLKDGAGILARFGVLALCLPHPTSTTLVGAVALGTAVAALGALTLTRRYSGVREPGGPVLRSHVRFALSAHFSSIVAAGSSFVLPAVTLTLAGASTAALVSMSMLIFTALTVLASSPAAAMLTLANDKGAHHDVVLSRSLRQSYMLMLPAALVLSLVAPLLMGSFGHAYHAATPLLRWLAASSIWVAANYVLDAYLLVRRRTGLYLAVNAIGSLAVLAACAVGASLGGATGLGIGWFCGQFVYTALSLFGYLAARR
jgi:O-antigen/teichoic acid export membrane protein